MRLNTEFIIGTLTVTYYDLFFFLGFVGVFLYLLWVRKKYDIPAWKTVVFTVLVYSVSLVWMFVLFWIENGFWGGNNIVRIFWWLGVFVIPVSKLLKLDTMKCLDFVSPCLCLNHGIAHLGCNFAGCCHGYESSWGLYSPEAGHVCFPNQIIESVVALGIAFFIWKREQKKGYQKRIDGLSFPIMLMVFGATRFLLEFLRDNNKVFLGISDLSIHAVTNFVMGLVFFIGIRHLNKRKQVPSADFLGRFR